MYPRGSESTLFEILQNKDPYENFQKNKFQDEMMRFHLGFELTTSGLQEQSSTIALFCTRKLQEKKFSTNYLSLNDISDNKECKPCIASKF